MNNVEQFANEQSAAEFVLNESVAILQKFNVKFVIVGGWVSYFFNRHLFGHPGTYDVDVLLNSSSLDDGSFNKASEAMLESNYIRAAKNQFQVYRLLKVSDEDILFHVDFLNEHAPENTLELQIGDGRIKSIYTPAMEVVFKYKKYRSTNSLKGINFPSEETFIVTKAAALPAKKRQRDAFDIYTTLIGSDNFQALCKCWRVMCEKDGIFHDANIIFGSQWNKEKPLSKLQRLWNR